ncbi:MAG: transcriptional repressor LexA [Candidatus Omnitrophica bacterium]|nr:transcriptional repressor LexA [Candidatus Omnitrophota bacterium]MBU1869919.1 transcriptional repressor LexA [Candidatus Omnitrophota bacterium]
MSQDNKVTGLTAKQEKVLNFIRERIQSNLPPTIREIAKEMGFGSTGTVRDYLDALSKKGYLRRTGKLSRSIELLKGAVNSIPLVATIPAGKPNLAYEDTENQLQLGDLLPAGANQNEIFALKVKGESMIEAGIMDGDTAIIRKQATAETGDIIAALLGNNEVTLKYLGRENGKFFLKPANSNYQPIYKPFTVIGKLVTIIRKY